MTGLHPHIPLLLNLLKRTLAPVGLLVLLTAQACADEKDIITVTISPTVQEQIQKASPDERKTLEAAISMGGKFIPYHFDGRAYDVGNSGIEEEWKFWLKNVRPLISKDVREWYNIDLSTPSTHYLTIKGHPDGLGTAGIASVCPKIELVSITATGERLGTSWKQWYPKSFAEDSFVLEYQAKIIGDLDSVAGPPRFFRVNKNDVFETVLVSLDKHNKVSQVASQYADRTWTAERQIRSLTRRISGIFAALSTADDKARLKQMIQQIKYEKTRVCKDMSFTTN